MGVEPASIPAWCAEGRSGAWAGRRRNWDLIVIGGGITGAGVFSLAVRSGLRTLLVEQGDFASGTSSRSSKLVHGGLRYLKQMQLRLTRESVQEREYLLKLAPGLVEPLPFLYPMVEGKRAESWLIGLGLNLYTHLARDLEPHQVLDAGELPVLVDPELAWSIQGGSIVCTHWCSGAKVSRASHCARSNKSASRAGSG